MKSHELLSVDAHLTDLVNSCHFVFRNFTIHLTTGTHTQIKCLISTSAPNTFSLPNVAISGFLSFRSLVATTHSSAAIDSITAPFTRSPEPLYHYTSPLTVCHVRGVSDEFGGRGGPAPGALISDG